jgi:hypothetical protein
MNVKTLCPDKGKLLSYLAMVIGLSMLFVGFLPIGYSGDSATGVSSIEIFNYQISASAEIVSALFYLHPILEAVGIGLFLLGLTWAVRRSSRTRSKYEVIAWTLLLFGASLFILSGIIEALRNPSSYDQYSVYTDYAKYAGLSISAFGVLFTAARLPMRSTWDKWIGCGLMGAGAFFSLASIPLLIDTNLNNTVSDLLSALLILAIPVTLLGIVWIEKSLVSTAGRMTNRLRLTMLISSIILLLGTMYYLMVYVSTFGMDVTAIGGTWSLILGYSYFLGIILVCGITMVLFIPVYW